MNYIKTVLFIFLIFAYYYSLGKIVFSFNLVRKNVFAFKVVSGFLINSTLFFIIGLLCEIFGKSWDSYFFIISVTLLLLILIFIVKSFKKSNFNVTTLKSVLEKILNKIISNLKNYWYVYLMVILFSTLSILNLMPYILNNYRDDHYIVKVVHLYKEKQLLSESYFSGHQLNFANTIDLLKQQGTRIFDTYELMYCYFGSLFKIDLTFFCRFSMTIHNYIILFLVYTLFGSVFVEEKDAQYTITFFSLLLIPAGFAARGNLPFKIRMFENWRIQTGMYMGGSIVRTMSFSLLIYGLSLLLLDKSNKVKYLLNTLLYFIFTFFSLISYQGTSISYIIFFIPVVILFFIFKKICKFESNFRYLYILVIFIIIFGLEYLIDKVTLMALSDSTFKFLFIKNFNLSTLLKNYTEYFKYYNDAFTYDIFARFTIVPLFLTILLCRREKEPIYLIVLFIYATFALNISKYYITLISLLPYGTGRMLTAMQIMCVSVWGISLFLIIERINQINSIFKYLQVFIPAFISFLVIFSITTNINKITSYSNEGDGITKFGYSISVLKDNDKMLPNMFVDIADYFENKKGNNYYILSEIEIPYEGKKYQQQSLLLASSKIKLLSNMGEGNKNLTSGVSKKEVTAFVEYNSYLAGKDWFNNMREYIKIYKINYILTTRKKVYLDLKSNGFKCVVGGNEKNYWLMKNE